MEKNLKAVLSNRIFMKRDDKLIDNLISELSYSFPGPTPKSKPIKICNLFGVNSSLISIPIGRTDLIPKNYTIIDKRVYNPVNFPESSITLRESQQDIYDTLDDNWIINAKPGWGKSFMALAIAGKLGQKTLVIVNTIKLRDQWVNECKKMYGFTPGIIGSGELNTEKPVTIANIQTLTNHILKYANTFGTVISDECHRLPATTFKNIIDKMRARYKIGLTGTLGRRDQKHALIPDFISKKIFIPAKENVIDPVIILYNSKFSIPGNFMIPWATRVNQLAYNPDYQQEIVNLVNAQTERGHKVLIVSDRIEFLENCSKITPDSICITSKTKNQKQLEQQIKNGEKTSLYGSINIYKEGISINELSCLILASPVANEYLLEQLVGRIMRICDNKPTPEVIDIVLSGGTGEKQFGIRRSFYINERFKIVTI